MLHFALFPLAAYTLAGYTFTTDVGATWAQFDVGLATMSSASADADWARTLEAYTTVVPGTNLALSTLLGSVLPSHRLAAATTAYWADSLAGDTHVRAAIGGTGEITAWNDASRRELLTKSAAYEVVRQFVMYLLHKGVDACNVQNGTGVEDWEIAYALHAGSLEGADGSGSGKSVYALGDKRCPQFGTCVPGTAIAKNNQAALDAWTAGVAALGAGRCFDALKASEHILAQLTVPLIQGTLREAYEVDKDGGAATADGVIEVAEGWAFASAILPQLALCNASVAQLVRTNMALSLTGADGAHVASGFGEVKAAIESLYGCLQIRCEDVGGMLTSDGAPIPGMEPCVDDAVTEPRGQLETCIHDRRRRDLVVVTSLAVALGITSLISAWFLCGWASKRTRKETDESTRAALGVAFVDATSSTSSNTQSVTPSAI